MELETKRIQEIIFLPMLANMHLPAFGNDPKQIVSKGALGRIMKAFK